MSGSLEIKEILWYALNAKVLIGISRKEIKISDAYGIK